MLLIEFTNLRCYVDLKKKNETSQSLNKYVKNYLIRDMNYITMYLKSSKYSSKLKTLINIL